MNDLTIRGLRNRGGAIRQQVSQGQALTATRGGKPVAQMRPLAQAPLPASVLLRRWRQLSTVDPVNLKDDLVATSETERAARQAHVQQAEADFDPLPFDASAAQAFGSVAASLRQAGRKTRARAYDAMIAAIALASGLPVYTCNPDDFAGIGVIEVVAVPVPD